MKKLILIIAVVMIASNVLADTPVDSTWIKLADRVESGIDRLSEKIGDGIEVSFPRIVRYYGIRLISSILMCSILFAVSLYLTIKFYNVIKDSSEYDDIGKKVATWIFGITASITFILLLVDLFAGLIPYLFEPEVATIKWFI